MGSLFSIAMGVALVGLFVLSVRFRKNIVALVHGIKLPRSILFLLVGIPYIIVEEQVNCGPEWCYRILVPPTLLPLMFFLLFLLIGVKLFRTKTVLKPMLIFSILGIMFELIFGSAHVAFQGLITRAPLGFILLSIWVGFSYRFVSFIPLAVLLDN